MALRKSKQVSDQGEQQVTLEIPVLPCEVSLARFAVGDDTYGVLMTSTVLTSGMWTLDRGQVGELWRQLRKLEQTMPKTGPKGLTVVERKLEVPGS